MRLLSTLLLLAAPAPAFAQLQPIGTLWEKGNASILVTTCPANFDHDDFCRGIELRRGDRVERLGAGYLSVKLLWTGRRGSPAPTRSSSAMMAGPGAMATCSPLRWRPS